ncbi:MAG: twin-arginine translocase TatA/TatE family subunit [Rudaea sp.]
MFGLQPWHLVVILGVALLVFGPSRLPEIGQAIGKSIREFREAATSAQDSIREGIEGRPEDRKVQDRSQVAVEYRPATPAEADKTDGQSKS